MDISKMTMKELAGMIDHTYLKATAVEADIEKLCAEAAENHFASACVNPVWAKKAASLLDGTGVAVAVTVGFPLGQNTIDVKAIEAEKAIEDGASEIDYVLNVGELKMGHTDYIRREMETMVNACRSRGARCKVIFETCYLTEEEIRTAALIAREVGPDFVKTSTGFGTGGAKAEDVRLMDEASGEHVQVKASGGIRDWETCRKMIEAGAARIGTSSGLSICESFASLQA